MNVKFETVGKNLLDRAIQIFGNFPGFTETLAESRMGFIPVSLSPVIGGDDEEANLAKFKARCAKPSLARLDLADRLGKKNATFIDAAMLALGGLEEDKELETALYSFEFYKLQEKLLASDKAYCFVVVDNFPAPGKNLSDEDAEALISSRSVALDQLLSATQLPVWVPDFRWVAPIAKLTPGTLNTECFLLTRDDDVANAEAFMTACTPEGQAAPIDKLHIVDYQMYRRYAGSCAVKKRGGTAVDVKLARSNIALAKVLCDSTERLNRLEACNQLLKILAASYAK